VIFEKFVTLQMVVESKQKKASFFDNPLKFIRPFVPLLPHVKTPLRAPSIREKFIWTVMAILVYLVASQVPLFGIRNSSSEDPLKWMRIMMASNRGSLMDLGISSVLYTSSIMNFLSMAGIITVDYSVKEDKLLYESLSKIIAIIATIGQSIIQIASGLYGPPKSLGYSFCFILLSQLIVAGMIIILLDELLQKGYGFGNGINLFIVTNVCEKIIWNAFSPKVFYTGRGMEFEGCVIAMVHLLFVRKNKLAALYEIFFRENLPNMYSLLSTITVFCFVVYMQSLKTELPIFSTVQKGSNGSYPINLLSNSTSSIYVQSTTISTITSISRMLYNSFPKHRLVRLLGTWDYKHNEGIAPVSGICYYIHAPSSLTDAIKRPFFFLTYLIIMLGSAAFLSTRMVEESSEVVAQRLRKQKMQIKGTRDGNMAEKLEQYIPVSSFLGGLLASAVSIFCDIFNVMGSGNNIFLAASIINQYIKLLAKESARKTGKAFIE
jgi:protein transport protein SEC61 subunit alpha